MHMSYGSAQNLTVIFVCPGLHAYCSVSTSSSCARRVAQCRRSSAPCVPVLSLVDVTRRGTFKASTQQPPPLPRPPWSLVPVLRRQRRSCLRKHHLSGHLLALPNALPHPLRRLAPVPLLCATRWTTTGLWIVRWPSWPRQRRWLPPTSDPRDGGGRESIAAKRLRPAADTRLSLPS